MVLIKFFISFVVLKLPLSPLPDTTINVINAIIANNINPIIKKFCFFITLLSIFKLYHTFTEISKKIIMFYKDQILNIYYYFVSVNNSLGLFFKLLDEDISKEIIRTKDINKTTYIINFGDILISKLVSVLLNPSTSAPPPS